MCSKIFPRIADCAGLAIQIHCWGKENSFIFLSERATTIVINNFWRGFPVNKYQFMTASTITVHAIHTEQIGTTTGCEPKTMHAKKIRTVCARPVISSFVSKSAPQTVEVGAKAKAKAKARKETAVAFTGPRMLTCYQSETRRHQQMSRVQSGTGHSNVIQAIFLPAVQLF